MTIVQRIKNNISEIRQMFEKIFEKSEYPGKPFPSGREPVQGWRFMGFWDGEHANGPVIAKGCKHKCVTWEEWENAKKGICTL